MGDYDADDKRDNRSYCICSSYGIYRVCCRNVFDDLHRDYMILGGQQMRNEARSVGISKRQAEYRARISVTSAIGSEMGISDIRKK